LLEIADCLSRLGAWELTFNATSSIKAQAISRGFVERAPLRPLAAPKRSLLLKPEIDRNLDGDDSRFPHIEADKLVGRYVAGYLLVVTRKSARNADLEQLEGLDEVWALCFRRPPPGFRLLGRFLGRDMFIGFRLYDRHELDGRKIYRQLARKVIDEWERAFGSIEPLRSRNLNAYLSGHFRDVDEKN
jgi:hypothetical protein